MSRLIINPIGGLGNRMRAISSGVSLCQDLQIDYEIVWPLNNELNCPFDYLFEQSEKIPQVSNVTNIIDLYLYDFPRKKNFFLSPLFQKGKYSVKLSDEKTLLDYIDNPLSLKNFLRGIQGNILVRSGLSFYKFKEDLYLQLFHPREYIVTNAISRIGNVRGNCIGLHIRRSDNLMSIKHSPLDLFINAMDKEIDVDQDVSFYLATDSEQVRNNLLNRYGKRIIYSTGPVSRKTQAGIQEALTEMVVLSMCSKIYGSYWSSFSEAAALLGGVSLMQLSV